jgi:hypothetical protein
MGGDMKRRRKPFEDKVKKVQKGTKNPASLGPGSSRSPGGKKRKRERGVKRGGRGERCKRDKRWSGVEWRWWLALWLLAAAAAGRWCYSTSCLARSLAPLVSVG